MLEITRRQLPALLGAAGLAPASNPDAIRTISRQAEYYHGWPTVARRAHGELALVWSGGRQAHVCPFGRVEWMVSRDEGETWSWPRVLLDTDLDDRDAGVLETQRGTLLVTTFTSLAYELVLPKLPAEQQEGWNSLQRRLPAEERRRLLGSWMLRSLDGGISWSTPYRVPVNSPHGPVSVTGGKLLYAGKDLYGAEGSVGVCESQDDGLTWRWLAKIPARPGDRAADYHELHMVEAGPARLLAHIRNHNEANKGETLQSESADRGKTWSVPHSIGVWGLPSHLLKLRDQRLLMTYGHRRQPFGNLARWSADEGHTWSEPITLSADGASGDLGYPSTVELSDGTLLTAWYERPAESPKAVLRQAKWKLPKRQ